MGPSDAGSARSSCTCVSTRECLPSARSAWKIRLLDTSWNHVPLSACLSLCPAPRVALGSQRMV